MSEFNGAFGLSLKRNNKQIREDRAQAIVEDAELEYKRSIEDLKKKLRTMRREQEYMLDLSPTNAQSLTLASDFDAKAYVTKDQELALSIRNTEILLDLAETRYAHLFTGGDTTNTEE